MVGFNAATSVTTLNVNGRKSKLTGHRSNQKEKPLCFYILAQTIGKWNLKNTILIESRKVRHSGINLTKDIQDLNNAEFKDELVNGEIQHVCGWENSVLLRCLSSGNGSVDSVPPRGPSHPSWPFFFFFLFGRNWKADLKIHVEM